MNSEFKKEIEEEILLVIAALLLDIGKLGYRAGERGSHQEIGQRLIQIYEDILPHEINSLISMNHNLDIENLFKKEESFILKKIIIADWLVSSERIGKEQITDVRKIGLTPIFSKIFHFKEGDNNNFYYLGKNLILDDGSAEIFPLIADKVSNLLEQNFLENWNLFKHKLERIKEYEGDYGEIFEFLYSLIVNHFKFIPYAAYRVEPDISLFDHSKMVCALAIAIHNYFKSNSINKEEEGKILNQMGQILKELYKKGKEYIKEIKKDPVKNEIFGTRSYFSLIHGDFSGIQNFIHTITSKFAAKTLKGRSFFFSLLTENYARYIIQELKLTEANIIFAGGGHFYIISHFSDDLGSKIKKFSIKINKLFIEQFNSNLYLALDYIPLSVEDLISKFSEIWKNVNRNTSIKKKKKFNDIIKTSGKQYFSKIFGPVMDSANKVERCVVCNSYDNLGFIEQENEDKWCIQCESFKELTDQLKNSEFYRIVQNSNKNYNKILNEFNNAVEFTKSAGEDIKNWYSINSPSLENTLGDKLLPIAFPLNNDDNITDNDELAENAQNRTGFNKIGILKMDVDSLGKIFQKGLGEYNTISRISTLSSSLSLFFDGYISKLVQLEFSDSVYLIFSGGDDLFAMGSWDKIIEFSFKLYKDFRRFTAFNPDVTISAGIVLETPKFPIMKASLLAEGELDKAKNFEPFTGKKNTKNRISLFGSVLKWDWTLEKEDEFQEIIKKGETVEKYNREQILEIMKDNDDKQINEKIFEWINNKSEFELTVILKDVFVYLIEKKDFSKSMLHKVENSVIGMRTLLNDSLEGRIRVPKLWRLKYYLRTVLRSRNPEVKLLSNFIVKMFEIIIINNLFIPDSNLQIKNVEFISVAVKWADYLTRNIKK